MVRGVPCSLRSIGLGSPESPQMDRILGIARSSSRSSSKRFENLPAGAGVGAADGEMATHSTTAPSTPSTAASTVASTVNLRESPSIPREPPSLEPPEADGLGAGWTVSAPIPTIPAPTTKGGSIPPPIPRPIPHVLTDDEAADAADSDAMREVEEMERQLARGGEEVRRSW